MTREISIHVESCDNGYIFRVYRGPAEGQDAESYHEFSPTLPDVAERIGQLLNINTESEGMVIPEFPE